MHALQRLVRIVSKAHKICNVKVLEIAATLHGPEALACPEIGSQVAAHMLIPSRTGASKTTNWNCCAFSSVKPLSLADSCRSHDILVKNITFLIENNIRISKQRLNKKN